MNPVQKILMERDGLSAKEAFTQLLEMRQLVREGANPEEVLEDIGLEPDYFFDILP